MQLEERYRGCLLGLAVGDALGTTLEFNYPGCFEPISDMIGGGPFGLNPGEWTDDTSMALCLAESLITKKGFDPVDQLERYVKWYEEGHLSSNGVCFDIGVTTLSSLKWFKKTRDPYCGPTGKRTAGNGSLMRLAPVPLFYASKPEMGILMSGESSRTTHQAPLAIDICRYFGSLIIGTLDGVTKDEILMPFYCPLAGYWENNPLNPEVIDVINGSYKNLNPPEIKGSGYVLKTFEAALWAFYNSNSFEEGCLKVVNLGEDADTTGAVYGQLAGAYYGAQEIPSRWLSKLAHKDLIVEMADKLLLLSDGFKHNSLEVNDI
jgi:ADP-ribosylglycohydrolase